jgi:acyl-CoA synthetase (AMP-forming)/AMP-acid ligase II
VTVSGTAAPVVTEEMLAVEGFWELIARRAEITGSSPILFDEHDSSLTFAGFRDKAERVAAALHEQGIGPGTRVAWQLPTRISTVLVMAALARLGAVQAPIIPIYRERETGSAVASASAEVFLVPGNWRGTDYVAMAESFPDPPRVLTIGQDAPESDGVLPPAPALSGDTRWIYFTSGSSGLPKGAQHADGSLLAAARGFAVRAAIRPPDVGSVPYPVAHVGGVVYLMTALLAGFPLVLVEVFDPARTLEVFRRYGVTTTGGSTVFYTALLAEQRKQPGVPLLPSLRLLKGGGAPCPPSVFRAAREELHATLAHDYGMTEVPMICVASPDDSEEQLAETEGKPIPTNQVRIVDDGVELPVGQDGEVQVKGPAVFRGYTDPAQTAEAFTADGWFRTGDLGHLRPDGHVEVTGRLKDVIIRKGEKIGPVELETLLSEHPAVGEVAVIGLPDDDRGERVCAVITLRPGAPQPSLGDVTAYLRDAGLMSQKLPEQLEVVDEIPRTGLGKFSKQALRRQFGPV